MIVSIRMSEMIYCCVFLILSSIPWLCLSVITVSYCISVSYGYLKLYQLNTPADTGDLPGISIIKPLKGIDDNLFSNLETHFKLKYPLLELLFCFEDPHDPAIHLVQSLQIKYPNVPTKIFTGGKDGILNPLVNNMAPAYEACQYELVWISTSRVKVSTDILLDMVNKIQKPDVALVHQMPFTADQKGLAAAIEKVYFGTVVPRYYFMSQVLNLCCFTGMSYLVKKSELDLLNGLPWYGRFLAEDYFFANALHKKGFKHQLSAIPAQQNISASLKSYRERMVRWQKLRINMLPLVSGILEPLGESIPLSICLSLTLWYFIDLNPVLCSILFLSVWCAVDFIQLKTVQNGPLPFSVPVYIIAWIARQVLFIFTYIEAITDHHTIKWGPKTYHLSNYGKSLQVVTRKNIVSL